MGVPSSSSQAAAARPNALRIRRRRLPKPDPLHESRVAWGKKWGALVREVTKDIRAEGK